MKIQEKYNYLCSILMSKYKNITSVEKVIPVCGTNISLVYSKGNGYNIIDDDGNLLCKYWYNMAKSKTLTFFRVELHNNWYILDIYGNLVYCKD